MSAPVALIICCILSTWWIDALSRTITDLGLLPLNGCNIGTMHLSKNRVNFSPFVVPSQISMP